MAGLYAKIDARMYADAKFCALSRPKPNGQSLWIFLMTGPHRNPVPGLFCGGESALAESLGWPLVGFRRAFDELAGFGMVQADWRNRVVWLPKAIRYNFPEFPNVVMGWQRHWDLIPECELKLVAFEALAAALSERAPFAEAFRKRCRPPFLLLNGHQSPIQEQEQYKPPNPLSAASAKPDPDAARRVVEHYQRVVAPAHDKAGAASNVEKLLRAEATEAELCGAADVYALTAKKAEPRYRYKARNFYGKAAHYKDFLPCDTDAVKTPEERRKAWEETPYTPG